MKMQIKCVGILYELNVNFKGPVYFVHLGALGASEPMAGLDLNLVLPDIEAAYVELH
jgi:hypothetical protein